jgi:alpha-L-fucosidase
MLSRISVVALAACAPVFAPVLGSAQITATAGAVSAIDWPGFLARHDLVWQRLPRGWGESAFIGNGRIGATIEQQDGVLGWNINRTDVVHASSRYPIGRAVLVTAGSSTAGSARLSLWDAEASGIVRTDRGEVRWRSFTATTPSVIAVVIEGSGGESAAELQWSPAEARPPSKVYRKEPMTAEDLHPAAVVTTTAAGVQSVQTFLGGGAHAESIVCAADSGGTKIYYIAIGRGANAGEALAEATAATTLARQRGLERVTADHRAWWHEYYPRSFLSFPDARLEAYYWIQIYKLGSAMRADGPILDLAGPWFRETPWPRIWWNLNIQLTYSPLFAANRLDLAESLFRALDRNRQTLRNNAPARLRDRAAVIGRSSGPDMVRPIDLATANSDAGHEAGNLPWTLYYYWLHYRYQMDDQMLRQRVYPLLRLAIGHYLAYAYRDDDGRYHLPKTHSPELGTLPDANYDLALFRWGLETLIASVARLRLEEPLLPRWREVLANLTPFPADSTGLWLGRDTPWPRSHRHYSHLLAIYPLALIRPDRPRDRALIEASLRTWEADPSAFRGYSFTGGASMHALLGDGDAALDRLNRFLDFPKYNEPNTLYAEAGPVIETPLSAATSIQELLLQSWGGALRVFPAVPTTWKDAAFDRLRGDGAFLVSAVRRDGRTAWVRIESLAGEPARVVVRDWHAAVVREHTGPTPRVTRANGGEFVLDLARGASVVLAPDATTPLAKLAPVALPSASQHTFPALKGEQAAAASDGELPVHERPEHEWWRKSMETRGQRLGWWREARFGMFIHWGVYSHLAGVWEGTPVTGYAEHIQRIRRIPIPVYRERVVAAFNPTRFDADEWIRTAKRAGMGYFIITAKHHDGFAMYDSDVSDYDVMAATPWHRDPMRELRDAARRHGVRFGFYYSHAFDWGEANGAGNDWDFQNPGGDLNLHGGRDWWLTAPELLPKIRQYVDRKAIPQVQELIRKYDPDIMWFDTPHKLPPEENLRILRAAREAGPHVVINGRAVQPLSGGPEARFGDYASTADRPAELIPHAGDWEAIPTTNESYGYHRMDRSHKPPEHFVQLLAKAAARGGNLLLNIGPMGDGRFDPRDVAILDGIARWMEVNGAAIHGTTRTPLPVQVWGQSTLAGARLYLHVFDWPNDGRLYVAGLASDVRSAHLLAQPHAPELPVRRVNAFDVEIQVPSTAPDPWNSVVVLDLFVPIETNPAFFLPATGGPFYLHVFDGQLVRPGIGYADGKRDRDVTVNWNRVDSGVDWSVRLATPARYRVALNYATASTEQTGAFEIAFGNQKVAGRVQPTATPTTFVTHDLGVVLLDAGELTVSVRAKEIAGGELMRLRRVELTPVGAR